MPSPARTGRTSLFGRERHRRVWRLAGPIMLANLSTPLLGAVDAAVMGHLPDPAYLGAVAVGALLFNFLYWGFGFLRMGTTGFTAQAHGAGDGEELRAVIARALSLSLALALVLLLLQWPISLLGFALIDASPEVTRLAGSYFAVRIWDAPAALANYAILGWLLGVQNARAVLALQVLANGSNILLNLLFVLGLGMAVEGVALATVLAQYLAAAIGFLYLRKSLRRHPGSWRREGLLDPPRLLALVRANRDIFLRTLALLLTFGTFTSFGAGLGDVTLAGNAILLNLLHFAAYSLDGFAHAAEVLVGWAVGAKSRGDFRAAVAVSSLWAAGAAIAASLVFLLLGPGIVSLFTDLPQVRQTAEAQLLWLAALPPVAVWAYQLDGIFIGATRTAAMRNAMALSLAAFLLFAWLLVPSYGNDGLWLALLLFSGVRALALALYYPGLERSLDGGEGEGREIAGLPNSGGCG